MSAAGGNRAIVAALAANLGIAVTKFVAFLLTGSSSMLAESIHSLADSGNQVLLLVGGRRASRAATPEHPFGYGRERYVFAFIVSVVLFSVGGLFALYEGCHKLQHPEPIDAWQWVPVAGAGGGDRPRVATRSAPPSTSPTRCAATLTWVQFVRRAKAPELPVVLLEDFAALIGLVLALFGVGLTLITDDGIWDGIGTDRDRCAAGLRGGRAGDRDQEPAARRGRHPRARGAGSRPPWWPTPSVSGSST